MRCQLVETNKRLVLLPSWVLVLCLGQFFFFFFCRDKHIFPFFVQSLMSAPLVSFISLQELPYELSSPYVDAVIFIPYIEINIVVISLI